MPVVTEEKVFVTKVMLEKDELIDLFNKNVEALKGRGSIGEKDKYSIQVFSKRNAEVCEDIGSIVITKVRETSL